MPWLAPVSSADGRARRGGQGTAVEVGQHEAVLVDRAPERVDQPPEVVDLAAVARAQRQAAAVDPGQPGRVRAAVGREDVAAEVIRVGLAGPDHGADHPGARRVAATPPGAAQERAPRRPSGGCRRARAASTIDASWRPSLTVPLASTTPSAPSAIANGAPGTRAAAHASVSSTSSKRRSDQRVAGERVGGGRDALAEAQPGLVKRASRTSPPSRPRTTRPAGSARSAAVPRPRAPAHRVARCGARRRARRRRPRPRRSAPSGSPGPRRAAAAPRTRRPAAPCDPRRRARAARRRRSTRTARPRCPAPSATTCATRKQASTSAGGVRRARRCRQRGTPPAPPRRATSAANAGAASRPGTPYAVSATIVPVRSAAFAAAAASRTVPISSHVVVATIRAQHSGGSRRSAVRAQQRLAAASLAPGGRQNVRPLGILPGGAGT